MPWHWTGPREAHAETVRAVRGREAQREAAVATRAGAGDRRPPRAAAALELDHAAGNLREQPSTEAQTLPAERIVGPGGDPQGGDHGHTLNSRRRRFSGVDKRDGRAGVGEIDDTDVARAAQRRREAVVAVGADSRAGQPLPDRLAGRLKLELDAVSGVDSAH